MVSGNSSDAMPVIPFDSNETAKLQGPSLYRIFGRPAAAVPDFAYSDAMREKGAAGLIWDAVSLDRYIADPESVVAGSHERATGAQ